MLKEPGGDPEKTITNILWVLMRALFKYDRKLMRELFMAAMSAPEELGRDLMADDMLIVDRLGKLISKYQSEGSVSRELNVERAVMVIYSCLIMIFHLYMGMVISKRELKKALADYIHIVFLGWKTEED